MARTRVLTAMSTSEAMIKKRSNGAIDESCGKRGVIGGSPFASHEATTEYLSSSVVTLFIINSERKEVSFSVLFSHDDGGEYHSLSVTPDNRCICLSGEFGDFKRNGVSKEFGFEFFSV